MAEVVQLGDGRTGKVREFWSGFWLAAVTLGFYEVWWYYRLNVEVRAIGCVLDDERLGRTLPGLSATAIVLGLLPSVPGDVPWPVGVAALVALAVSLVSSTASVGASGARRSLSESRSATASGAGRSSCCFPARCS